LETQEAADYKGNGVCISLLQTWVLTRFKKTKNKKPKNTYLTSCIPLLLCVGDLQRKSPPLGFTGQVFALRRIEGQG